MASIQIGHLLRAGTTGFVAGCSVSQAETPAFGTLVRAPLDKDYSVYGLIHDIHIDDDGLVRQLSHRREHQHRGDARQPRAAHRAGRDVGAGSGLRAGRKDFPPAASPPSPQPG